ncbi:hypothetical protein QBC46DRAFT_346864 [Diplogelasinospora grovesii]|uniref:F-box domain-containing protein n=1 Tax=Diplogelasinospora grovesii TaxID=303347 RepID=A0AAN6RZ38_9PEZI|nr:hypothetical protein QBC46DRAFT_346864 [Diplogelasinospora grovesii]
MGFSRVMVRHFAATDRRSRTRVYTPALDNDGQRDAINASQLPSTPSTPSPNNSRNYMEAKGHARMGQNNLRTATGSLPRTQPVGSSYYYILRPPPSPKLYHLCDSVGGGPSMFALSRWIRKRRQECQPLEETKAREAERRIQLEKRGEQQARALRLTLHELQSTMDPLMAAQAYNNRFCPFGRLPEELCLHILDFLSDDAVTLHCLRMVSKTFRRLLNCESDIWKDAWYYDGYTKRSGIHPIFLRDILRERYRRLLQRDGRCDNCRRWNDTQGQRYGDCKFQQDRRRCHYGDEYRRLYCNPCDSLHDVCQFSSTYQQAWRQQQQERRCLGQQGSVQLCEHVQIAWASIKAHIDDWRQQQREPGGGGGGRDWQACLDSFHIECHDASHDMRCTASEAPTWPRARLRTGTSNRDIVVLSLEWTPHSRIDALALTADGRIPASELRVLFQRLRRLGPADTLYPPVRPGALPEMAYFSPSAPIGPFIYYETGEDDDKTPAAAAAAGLPTTITITTTTTTTTTTPPPSFPLLPSDPSGSWWRLCCRKMSRSHGFGEDDQELIIKPHYPRGAGGTGIQWQCLAVSYQKDVMVCKTTAVTDPAVPITPTDHWLHAMDPDTYDYPQASHIRPQCRDVACTNYYRRRKKDYYTCPPWPSADAVSRMLESRRRAE